MYSSITASVFLASRASLNTFSRRALNLSITSSASDTEMSPRPISASVYRRLTERFCSIRSYILGCVKLGSSPSLWPRRR